MGTWLDFKTHVGELLLVDANRLNTSTFRDRQIRAAVKDLQHYIPTYRIGHETIYQVDDLAEEGFSSVGSLPAGASPRKGRYVKVGNPVNSQPLTDYSWDNVEDLTAGHPRGCLYAISIDPWNATFHVFPKVTEDRYLSIHWDGLKSDFQDSEEVPFDELAAEAAALWVKKFFAREVDKDLVMAASYDFDYQSARTKAYLHHKDRGRLKSSAQSPQPGVGCAPTTQDDTTVEFVAFGDSGEVPLNETEKIAGLVNTLEPDFIVHLGDASYPDASEVYLQDNLVAFYNSFIYGEKFHWSPGNHDLDAGGGADLHNVLAYLKDLNSGKLYYKFSIGDVIEFFVLNGNLNTAGGTVIPADGVGLGSAQDTWLQTELGNSGAAWKIVVLHHAPYTSDVSRGPGTVAWRLDYKGYGAHLVLSGHGHNYERLLVGGLPYLVAGFGGATKRGFGAITTGSQFRYNTLHGVLKISANLTRLQSSFVNLDGEVIDSLILRKS